MEFDYPVITLMILAPFIGAIAQISIPSREMGGVSRWVALLSSLFSSAAAVSLVFPMRTETWGYQFRESFPWVGSYAIQYDVAVDGLNILMVLLVAVVFPLVILSEWKRKERVRGIHGLVLVLQSCLFGVACAQDLFLLFFFWALSSLPFYFLISVWGKKEREETAFRYVMTASIGNALFFVSLILVYYSVTPNTFSIQELLGGKASGTFIDLGGTSVSVSFLGFVLMSLGIALRIPVWPIHGWFTNVMRNSPPVVVSVLAGAFVPVGLYVFARVGFSLFPDEFNSFSNGILLFGAVSLLMGAMCAVSQRELRLVISYLGLSQTGFVLIGLGSLDSAGVVGSVYHSLSFGLGIAGLALFTSVLGDRFGHTMFLNQAGRTEFGGVAGRAPQMALVTGFLLVSVLGIPGFGGFVGQSLIMMGGYGVHPGALAILGIGVLFLTYGLFSVYRFVFLGDGGQKTEGVLDLTFLERGYLFPLVGVLLLLGVYPKPLLDLIRPSVLTLLSIVR